MSGMLLCSFSPHRSKKTVDIELQKIHNEVTDREQHKTYLSILGNDVPENFNDFQRLKYEQPEKWRQLEEINKVNPLVKTNFR